MEDINYTTPETDGRRILQINLRRPSQLPSIKPSFPPSEHPSKEPTQIPTVQLFGFDGFIGMNQFSVVGVPDNMGKFYSKSACSPIEPKCLVLWEKKQSDWDVMGRIINIDNNSGGRAFDVASNTDADQTRMDGAALKNGNFVVVWDSFNSKESWNVYLNIFNSNGVKLLNQDQKINTISSSTVNPHVAVLENGDFVVTWHSGHANKCGGLQGYGCEIFAKSFSENGEAKNPEEFIVNTETAWSQWFTAITATQGGGFAIAWLSGHRFGYYQVYLQNFDANYEKVGSEKLISSFNNMQQEIENVVSAITDLGEGYLGIAYNYASTFDVDDSNQNLFAQGGLFNYKSNINAGFFPIYANSFNTPGGVNIVNLPGDYFATMWHMQNYYGGNSWDPYIQFYKMTGSSISYVDLNYAPTDEPTPLRVNHITNGVQGSGSITFSTFSNKILTTWYTSESATLEATLISLQSIKNDEDSNNVSKNPTNYPTLAPTFFEAENNKIYFSDICKKGPLLKPPINKDTDSDGKEDWICEYTNGTIEICKSDGSTELQCSGLTTIKYISNYDSGE